MILVTSVEVLHHRVVRLGFNDGSQREVDLSPLMKGSLFEILRQDDHLFSAVFVDPPYGGTITWPNGADLDPDVLHGDAVPASPSTRP